MLRERILSLALAGLLISLGASQYQQEAIAAHQGGDTYTGTHAGGGAMGFTIAPDGSRIVSFTATNVPGNGCTITQTSTTFSNLTIVNEQFSQTASSSGISLSGTFAPDRSASGTFQIRQTGPFACNSGVLSWSATPGSTGGPATPTPTATPTSTPTPTLVPVSCSPRPRVTLSVTRIGPDQLQVVVGATGTGNILTRLDWTAPPNAAVELPDGTPLPNGLTPPSGASSVAFVLRRLNGSSVTMPITVLDRCGSWPTFVGGGSSAW
jgi:hypothetical protein